MNPQLSRYAAPGIAVFVGMAYLIAVMVPPSDPPDKMQIQQAASIAVVDGGRTKPLDTVARNSLMIISARQTFRDENEESQSAIRWLLEVMSNRPFDFSKDTRQTFADGRSATQQKFFRIDSEAVLSLFKLLPRPGLLYSFEEFRPGMKEFLLEIKRISAHRGRVHPKDIDPFDREIMDLHQAMKLFLAQANHHKVIRIENDQVLSLLGLTPRSGFRYALVELIPRKREFLAQVDRVQGVPEKNRDLFDAKIAELHQHLNLYLSLYGRAAPLVVPPLNTGNDWQSLLESEDANPGANAFMDILDAYSRGNAADFNRALVEQRKVLERHLPEGAGRTEFETFFNHFAPFYQCSVLSVFVFILACVGWVAFTRPLHRAAFALALVTVVVHTFALVGRMYLMDRPFVFVTNLYSSAVFIGWMCVILGLILEWLFTNGIGSVVAGVTGFITLLIGHFLATSGDTIDMMQAVLDTNFWLATHVTSITIGYSATFVAGCLGILLIGLGVFTTSLDRELYKTLGRMIYGIVCFAMLFSFTGTVLGGIWADQSWGRFWGWDPKENGALLIVLMNALILHARWGGLVQQRGMAVLAVCGNIVTAWSWFGVNMLGVGLHSYGFMSGTVFWLLAFVASQLVMVGLGLLPFHVWRSFAAAKPLLPPPEPLLSRDGDAIRVSRIKMGTKKSKFVKARR